LLGRAGVLVVVAALGCGGRQAASDLRDGGASDAADASTFCCPMEPPSCTCPVLGGRRPASGDCERICDSPPVGWVSAVDDAGCPYWIPNLQGTCIPPPEDAGPDALRDDAGTGAPLDAASSGDGAPDGPPPGCELCGPQDVCDVRSCAPGANGTCTPRPTECPPDWDPVCDCTGRTQPTDCGRLRATGAPPLFHTGTCRLCVDVDLEHNDSPQMATILDAMLQSHPQGFTVSMLDICAPFDVDYYSFTLVTAKTATVTISYQVAQGELSCSLLDGSLHVIAVGAPAGGGLQAQAPLTAEKYYIRVAAGSATTSNTYDLSLALSP
jgi:hypothetical protein